MGIKAKFQGGPLNHQRKEVGYGDDRILVNEPLPIDYRNMVGKPEPYSDAQLSFKTGDYVRSNKKLKNGTVVYIWMGWRE